nr:hypothetical protein [Mycoplasmopsis bovis]
MRLKKKIWTIEKIEHIEKDYIKTEKTQLNYHNIEGNVKSIK